MVSTILQIYYLPYATTFNALILLCIIMLLLFISAFVSSSEVAFFSLTPTELEEIEKEESNHDYIIKKLLDEQEYLLSTILITNNLVNVSIIILATYLIHNSLDFGGSEVLQFVFESVIITFIILLLSEIMPKIFAQQHQLAMSRFAAPILLFLRYILKPFNYLLVTSTSLVNKQLAKHKHNNLTLDDLSQALELTQDTITDDADILQGIVNFGNITAAGIMTSRMDMVTVDIKDSFDKVIATIVEHEYSRMPVLHGSDDNIRGILYAKDLIPHISKGANFKWQTLIRQAYFVPETIKIDDLLQDFQKNRIHIAIVVDEFGGTSGIVTMEDILEEVVGEISDEHDQEEELLYTKLDENSYLFEAKILLTDFFKATDSDPEIFEESIEDVDTLAGLLLELKGDFPAENEVITYKNFTFEVAKVNLRRIEKVKVTITKEEHEED